MNEFIDNEDRKPEDYILPDGKPIGTVEISEYVQYIINKHKEFVLPECTSDLETLEYICAHGDF